MLDDNLDPTPLLKEIRDDKVATIIIDANASVSYLILKKVSSLKHQCIFQTRPCLYDVKLLVHSTNSDTLVGFELFSLKHLGNFSCSPEGNARLPISETLKQLPQSLTSCAFVAVTELTIFTFSVLESCTGNNIYSCLPATITYIQKNVLDKRAFCWDAVFQMFPGPFLILGQACDAESQHMSHN